LHERLDRGITEAKVESAVGDEQLGSHVVFEKRYHPFSALVSRLRVCHGGILPSTSLRQKRPTRGMCVRCHESVTHRETLEIVVQ
jgi:hypothetical protein